MRVNWRQRLAQEPSLWSFGQWPVIPADTIPRARRAAFLRGQRIVAGVLSGQTLTTVAAEHDVSPQWVSQLMSRCLAGTAGEAPALTAALIPHRRLVASRREARLPDFDRPSGTACAFSRLLEEAPWLREALDEMILAYLRDAPNAERLTPRSFFGRFHAVLAERQWPADRYPYTTASQGYQSVRRHLQRRTVELQRERQRGTTHHRRTRLAANDPRRRAQRVTQIDEHILDLRTRVQLRIDDRLLELPLARPNVLIAVDRDTTCVLGYFLAPARHANQQHLLTLLDRCVTPWTPPDLTTPGLSYAPGAIFPSGADEEFPVTFGTVQLDNALMHRARSVVDLLCTRFGATLHYGHPATPTERSQAEHTFDYIARTVTHRLPSTTGSSVIDPKRESRKNLKKPPLTTFQTIDEAISVVLTEHNIRPQVGLGGARPLELFREQCANHFVRYVPADRIREWRSILASEPVTVHWTRDGGRSPFINFCYARYHGPGLAAVAGREKTILVEYDWRDIRTLHACKLDGTPLGELEVAGRWQRFPHSIATRKAVARFTRDQRGQMRDPIAGWVYSLMERTDEPSASLKLLEAHTELTAGQDRSLVLQEAEADRGGRADTGVSEAPPTSANPTRAAKRHVWRAARAYHWSRS